VEESLVDRAARSDFSLSFVILDALPDVIVDERLRGRGGPTLTVLIVVVFIRSDIQVRSPEVRENPSLRDGSCISVSILG